jgi:hypothetical protein
MVDGSMGTDLPRLAAEFRAAAGTLAAPDRLAAGRQELAAAAAEAASGGRFPPAAARTGSTADPVVRNWLAEDEGFHLPRLGRPSPGALAVGAGLVVLLVLAIAVVNQPRRAAPTAGRVTTAAPRATPTPLPTATPSPTPTGFGPAAAGPIHAVELALQGSCSPGASCPVEVTVRFTPSPAPEDYVWTIKARDPCTGRVTDLPGNRVRAQTGWTTVIGDSSVQLPAGTGGVIVAAVTSLPAQAASPSVRVGSGTCP